MKKLGKSVKRRYLRIFRIAILTGIGHRAVERMMIIQVIDGLQWEIKRHGSKNFSISLLALYEIRFYHSFSSLRKAFTLMWSPSVDRMMAPC